MAILRSHILFYEEMFALEGFLADPVLVFGVQDIRRDEVSIPMRVRIKNLLAALGSPHAKVAFPKQLRDQWRSVRRSPPPLPADYVRSDHLTELFQLRGLKDVKTLDLYDPRSDLRYDMNRPVPSRNTAGSTPSSTSDRSSMSSTRASALRTLYG